MKCYFSSMIKKLILAMCVLVSVVLTAPEVRADAAAERILAGARYASTLQHQDLHGEMTKNGRKTPITLFLKGDNIQFYYKVGRAESRFHMRLKSDRFDLLEIVGGKTKKFADSKMASKINKTDLTFEDLSMRFLYWKNSQIVGEEKVNGQLCYKLRLINPSRKSGDYRIVYAWVHKKYAALMKVVGYNQAGKPLKQFQVTDLMRVGKEYTLRRMRVDTIDAKSNKTTGITYLEFQKPKKSGR